MTAESLWRSLLRTTVTPIVILGLVPAPRATGADPPGLEPQPRVARQAAVFDCLHSVRESDGHLEVLGDCFAERFDRLRLHRRSWAIFHGEPRVVGDRLLLAADAASRAEVQTRRRFLYGLLRIAIDSDDFRPQSEFTDTSFGYEVFAGGNGECHYAALLSGGGHLGLLRARPDANGDCSGDPEDQAFLPIPNWDAMRTRGKAIVTLLWKPDVVTLRVTNGGRREGVARYTGVAIPSEPMAIRLNADFEETHFIDSVHHYEPVE